MKTVHVEDVEEVVMQKLAHRGKFERPAFPEPCKASRLLFLLLEVKVVENQLWNSESYRVLVLRHDFW